MLGKGKDICAKGFHKDSINDLEDELNRWLANEGKDLTIHDIKYCFGGLGERNCAMVIFSL